MHLRSAWIVEIAVRDYSVAHSLFGMSRNPFTRVSGACEYTPICHSHFQQDAACRSPNYFIASLYQRRTRSARSVFQRLAPPTSVSIFSGMYSGWSKFIGQRPFWWRR